MGERAQVLLLQVVGFVAIVFATVASAWVSRTYSLPPELLTGLASVIALLVGKLFGQPVSLVTLNSVASMPPRLAAQLATRAIASLPPASRAELAGAQVVLTGLSDPPPPAAAVNP